MKLTHERGWVDPETSMATRYTVHDSAGPRLETDSPVVAEAHSRIGLLVTASTGEDEDFA